MNSLLEEKDLNTILNKTRNWHRLKDYILDSRAISVFYATRDGKAQVIDIKNDDIKTMADHVFDNAGGV